MLSGESSRNETDMQKFLSVYIGIININLLIGEKAKTLDFAVGFI